MDNDNTQDGAEPSLASAGSQPVAWAVHYGLDPDPEVHWGYPRHAAESGRMIIPLYRSPTLTDEEREAIEEAIRLGDQWGWSETLRGLLERLG
jgi:hypothetical protein